MKQKINLRLIGIAVIAVLATAIGITFIYYGLFKKQVQAGLRTNAEVLMETGVFEKSSQYADVKLPINNLRVTWIDSDGVVLFDNVRHQPQIVTDQLFPGSGIPGAQGTEGGGFLPGCERTRKAAAFQMERQKQKFCGEKLQ